MKMQNTPAALALSAALLFGAAPLVSAQDHHDDQRAPEQHNGAPQQGHDNHGANHAAPQGQNGPHGFVRHDDWRKGAHMQMNDWNRGQRLDWRARHFNRPPRGYEWREVDGHYVLAAITTGVILTILEAAH